jgi:hypothetical protein
VSDRTASIAFLASISISAEYDVSIALMRPAMKNVMPQQATPKTASGKSDFCQIRISVKKLMVIPRRQAAVG